MMAGYHVSGMSEKRATFEAFVRKLPSGRAYLVFAGLEQAVFDLLNLRFSAEQIDSIRQWPMFAAIPESFFDRLAGFQFEGDLWAVPEGTVVFPGESLIRVSAPLFQAQLVETFLLSSLAYPTLVASKAARLVSVADGRALLEFGARRGHGPHAGFLAARSAYLAGFTGTSHAEAARRLGIPPSGTMAHSWVQSFPSEEEAFRAYAHAFPTATTLLVDTYDTLTGIRRAAEIEPPIQAIRIDSGDLDRLSREARLMLDSRNRCEVTIVASGDLDEFQVAKLVEAGAPIDAFGVGTELITSRDAPALALVYKLVEIEGKGRYKLSPGKKTYPMAKQVFRQSDSAGKFSGDLVTLATERAEGEPLLAPVVRDGQHVGTWPTLGQIRERCRNQLRSLPDPLLDLDALPSYPIFYSEALEAEAMRLMRSSG
jgi:nicotinate phosphoribosyltransferase